MRLFKRFNAELRIITVLCFATWASVCFAQDVGLIPAGFTWEYFLSDGMTGPYNYIVQYRVGEGTVTIDDDEYYVFEPIAGWRYKKSQTVEESEDVSYDLASNIRYIDTYYLREENGCVYTCAPFPIVHSNGYADHECLVFDTNADAGCTIEIVCGWQGEYYDEMQNIRLKDVRSIGCGDLTFPCFDFVEITGSDEVFESEVKHYVVGIGFASVDNDPVETVGNMAIYDYKGNRPLNGTSGFVLNRVLDESDKEVFVGAGIPSPGTSKVTDCNMSDYHISINSNCVTVSKAIGIHLTSSLGVSLYSEDDTIEYSSLPAGIYILSFYTSEHGLISKKIYLN